MIAKINPTANLDRYLREDKTFQRLTDEYKKQGSIVIAYDFDGTVYDSEKEGIEFFIVPELLRRIRDLDLAKLIVFTGRSENEYSEIMSYLEKNNIPYDQISQNGKSPYNLLLDDRAGLKSAYDTLNRFVKCVEHGYI